MPHDVYYPAGRITSDQILTSVSPEGTGEELRFFYSKSTEGCDCETTNSSSSSYSKEGRDNDNDNPKTSDEGGFTDSALVFGTSTESYSEEDYRAVPGDVNFISSSVDYDNDNSVGPRIKQVQMQLNSAAHARPNALHPRPSAASKPIPIPKPQVRVLCVRSERHTPHIHNFSLLTPSQFESEISPCSSEDNEVTSFVERIAMKVMESALGRDFAPSSPPSTPTGLGYLKEVRESVYRASEANATS